MTFLRDFKKYISFGVFFLISCKHNVQITVSGQLLRGYNDSITLYRLTPQGKYLFQSSLLGDASGDFSFLIKAAFPNNYVLKAGQQEAKFYADDEDVFINFSRGDSLPLVLSGPNNTVLNHIKSIQRMHHEQINRIDEQIKNTYQIDFDGGQLAILKLKQSQYLYFQNQLKELIDLYPDSPVITEALDLLTQKSEFKYKSTKYNALVQNFPHIPFIRAKYLQFLEAHKSERNNNKAPDFTYTDSQGKSISLNDFLGKYVLIDFWASWCGPCREASPQIHRLYKKYREKGLELLGVSLDDSKKEWILAMEEDGALGTQVIAKNYEDLQVLYSFQGIPFYVLVNPQGKIIAKGRELSNDNISEKLKHIFME